MLKVCDACADMGQLYRTVPILKTFRGAFNSGLFLVVSCSKENPEFCAVCIQECSRLCFEAFQCCTTPTESNISVAEAEPRHHQCLHALFTQSALQFILHSSLRAKSPLTFNRCNWNAMHYSRLHGL